MARVLWVYVFLIHIQVLWSGTVHYCSGLRFTLYVFWINRWEAHSAWWLGFWLSLAWCELWGTQELLCVGSTCCFSGWLPGPHCGVRTSVQQDFTMRRIVLGFFSDVLQSLLAAPANVLVAQRFVEAWACWLRSWRSSLYWLEMGDAGASPWCCVVRLGQVLGYVAQVSPPWRQLDGFQQLVIIASGHSRLGLVADHRLQRVRDISLDLWHFQDLFARRSRSGVHLEHGLDDLRQVVRKVGSNWWVPSALDLLREHWHARCLERWAQHGHFIQDAPSAPNVTLFIVGLVLPDFWACIIWSTGLSLEEGTLRNFGYVEVTEF